ncbi:MULTISPECIES: hypothetical protein [Cytobacillus]|uniref:Uncharacterized protein n=2 Tax=Cytobacillus TaxID=2675230 RepID=A0A248TPW0_9BACI|nr:hypothetical protein [Cytobacillus kochii]ASV70175.1 hypothetical protein CKF48_23085 [Cytobacillus kochii]MDQ0186607.1 hypothetical protein [Cytobacillus kochii]
MLTCAYCATELSSKYCPFCEMELKDYQISKNGNRMSNTIDSIPAEVEIFKDTKTLMEKETIELLFLLRYARKHRSDVYNLRINVHRATEQGNEMQEYNAASYSDYEEATRKVWVIENIIKERIGYFPSKVTEKFIYIYLDRINQSNEKKMKIKESSVQENA